MDFTHQKLINLVNNSIKNITYDIPLTMDDFLLMRYNQLSGISYPVLKNQNEEVLEKFRKEHFLYIKQDETQKRIINDLKDIFNNNKIDFVFLKGSYLKTIYPHSYMRIMGDIDVLVRPDKMNEIHKILKENGYRNWSNSTNHDCFYKERINVEIHPKLDSEFENGYEELFLEPWKYTKHLENCEYVLNLEYNFVYQVYHMMKHLYHSGVGYRTIVDFYVFFKANLKSFNLVEYQRLYQLFPKREFLDYIIYLIDSLFSDVDLKKYILNDKMTKNNVDNFINYLFHSGAHGINDEHNLFIGGLANKSKDKKTTIFTKIRFLFGKVFLNLKTMKGMYRYLNKYPIFLPFAWVQRIFRLIFKKNSRSKLESLKIKNQEIDKVKQLFDEIGI
jgi:hypothetical protein